MASTLINLLPDVRLAKIRDKQTRRLVVGVTMAVIGSSLLIVAVLFLVTLGQNIKLTTLQSEIDQKRTEINSVPDITKVLTAQQHLASLPELYSQRVYLVKFFGVLAAASPKDIALQKMEIDAQSNIKFTAQARNYGMATKFAKALEASNQGTVSSSGSTDFTNIKLEALSLEKDGKVSFSLTTPVSTGVINGR